MSATAAPPAIEPLYAAFARPHRPRRGAAYLQRLRGGDERHRNGQPDRTRTSAVSVRWGAVTGGFCLYNFFRALPIDSTLSNAGSVALPL